MRTTAPLQTPEEYTAALRRIDALMNAPSAKPARCTQDTFETLVSLICDYEDKYFPIPPPNPNEYASFLIESGQINKGSGDLRVAHYTTIKT